MPSLSPSDASLIDLQSSAVDVLATVQASPDAGETLTALRVEHDLPSLFTVTVDLELWQVRISAPSLLAAFPVAFIRHTHNGETDTVYSFDDVPAGASIYGFQPSSSTVVVFNLTVFATGSLAPLSETSKAYTVTIRQNFNTGKAALLAALSEA